MNDESNSVNLKKRTRFLSTLYGKISTTTMVLLIVVGLSEFGISFWLWSVVDEVGTQLRYWRLAEQVSGRLKPYVTETPDFVAAQRLISEINEINPSVTVLLLDATGEILADFANHPLNVEVIPLDPVKKFLTSTSWSDLPIRGINPVEKKSKSVISVAELKIGGKPGYLYIILNNGDVATSGSVFRENVIFFMSGLLALAVSISGGLLGLFAFRSLGKRLNRLTTVIEGIESGDLNSRSDEKSIDEIGRLGRTLNLMSTAISKNIEDLHQKDIQRKELIANVSHDLATPASLIGNYLELLLTSVENLPAEKRKSYYETLIRNSQSLNTLLAELVDLSKVESPTLTPVLEDVSLREFYEDIATMLTPKLEQEELTFEIEIAEPLSTVRADRHLLERAIVNLVGNAIRHTPKGGKVILGASVSHGLVCIDVGDTGEGIPEHIANSLFDRHVQGGQNDGKSGTKKKFGLGGLGLSIVKRIVELHGGSIVAQPREPNGTIFRIRLEATGIDNSTYNANPNM